MPSAAGLPAGAPGVLRSGCEPTILVVVGTFILGTLIANGVSVAALSKQSSDHFKNDAGNRRLLVVPTATQKPGGVAAALTSASNSRRLAETAATSALTAPALRTATTAALVGPAGPVSPGPGPAGEGRLHKTATIGDNVILECPFEYPNDTPVPYLVQWHKKDHKIPIYIWYESYPPHASDEFRDRVSLADKTSLNLTSVRASDKGWFECTVFFINREEAKNGSWIFLDVLAPPYFKTKPPETIYVRAGQTVILPCKAQGTPTPSISWEKDSVPLEVAAGGSPEGVGGGGGGTLTIGEHELRIVGVREADTGLYQCIARNSQGTMEARSRLVIAGPARIISRPLNTTVIENNVAELRCEARAQPSNISHRWLYNGVEISRLTWLQTRTLVRQDGALFINPTNADDSGWYTCEVANGIGEPDSAQAYVNIEYPAKVNFTPNFQYMPLHLAGMIKCFVTSNPPLQFVTWFKDKRPFEPSTVNGVVALPNGTLHFSNVSKEHEGAYMCSPFNIHGTGGASKVMEVLVREPPAFSTKPNEIYQQRRNADITLVCEGRGQPMPTISWRRADGRPLPKQRFSINQEIVKTVSSGNLTLRSIQKEDHGRYECILQNEVATLVTSSLLLVESTTPHAPTNVSVVAAATSATVSWLPGYDGGHEQSYILWYRPEKKPSTIVSGLPDGQKSPKQTQHQEGEWRTIRVHPDNVTSITIHNLQPETKYEFQVLSRNEVGDGFFSEKVLADTTNGIVLTPPSSGAEANIPGSTREGGELGPGLPDLPGGMFLTESGIDEMSEPSWHAGMPPFSPEPPSPTPDVPNLLTVAPPSEVGKEPVVVTWAVPARSNHSAPLSHFNVEYKQDESHAWTKSADNVYPDTDQGVLHFNLREYPREAKVLLVRVVAYSPFGTTNATPHVNITVRNDTGALSQKYRRDRAIVSGVVGGILFFFVAIILSVCAVKICNKRRRRKAEKAYMMVTCGSHSAQQQQTVSATSPAGGECVAASRSGPNGMECTHGSGGSVMHAAAAHSGSVHHAALHARGTLTIKR